MINDARAPSSEQIGELDFREACAQETMRLKSVAPLLGVEAVKDTVMLT